MPGASSRQLTFALLCAVRCRTKRREHDSGGEDATEHDSYSTRRPAPVPVAPDNKVEVDSVAKGAAIQHYHPAAWRTAAEANAAQPLPDTMHPGAFGVTRGVTRGSSR